jgi:hypothetical protein
MTHVDFELAKMLMDIGYSMPDAQFNFEKDKLPSCSGVPTYSEAADFLRDRYGLHLCLSTNENHDGWICALQIKGEYEPVGLIEQDEAKPTHAAALAAAITKAAEIVKERKNPA